MWQEETMFAPMSSLALTNIVENSIPSRSAKAVNTKPKGLSVRSESDRNICSSSSKNLETQKKDSLLKVVREKQKSGLSPKSKSPHSFGRKKLGEEFTFKKPITPVPFGKKNIIKEPERLAGGYYDQEKYFNQNLYDVGRDKEFAALFTSRLTILPFEDDCFSDLEKLEIPKVSINLMSNSEFSKYSRENISGPEIPSL